MEGDGVVERFDGWRRLHWHDFGHRVAQQPPKQDDAPSTLQVHSTEQAGGM